MTQKEYNKSVDAFSDGIYRFILRNIGDSFRAKDIVQDTYEKLWLNREAVNYDKAKSYLFTTAYHSMIDGIRADKRARKYREERYYTKSRINDKQYSDLAEILEEAVDKLPEIQRSVILLRDYEGYSYKEIGEVTGLNESQVKVYIYRARVFLKNYIGTLETVL